MPSFTIGKISYDCVIEENEGNKLAKCAPFEKKGEIRESLSDAPVELKAIGNGQWEVIAERGISEANLRGLAAHMDEFYGSPRRG